MSGTESMFSFDNHESDKVLLCWLLYISLQFGMFGGAKRLKITFENNGPTTLNPTFN